LLGDGRSTLTKHCQALSFVGPAYPGHPRQYGSDSDFLQDTRDSGVVNRAMREKVLVFGGENRVADNQRYLLVLNYVTMLSRELHEQFTLVVVHVTNRRTIKTHKGFYVWQVSTIEVQVVKRDREQCCGEE